MIYRFLHSLQTTAMQIPSTLKKLPSKNFARIFLLNFSENPAEKVWREFSNDEKILIINEHIFSMSRKEKIMKYFKIVGKSIKIMRRTWKICLWEYEMHGWKIKDYLKKLQKIKK